MFISLLKIFSEELSELCSKSCFYCYMKGTGSSLHLGLVPGQGQQGLQEGHRAPCEELSFITCLMQSPEDMSNTIVLPGNIMQCL